MAKVEGQETWNILNTSFTGRGGRREGGVREVGKEYGLVPLSHHILDPLLNLTLHLTPWRHHQVHILVSIRELLYKINKWIHLKVKILQFIMHLTLREETLLLHIRWFLWRKHGRIGGEEFIFTLKLMKAETPSFVLLISLVFFAF